MMTDDERRYEDLRHFMLNSGTPARGARHLLSFEGEMHNRCAPKDDHEASFRKYATAQYRAVLNPSPLATAEQIEFCCRTKEEMEKWRAMYEAGWKTPCEEGHDAFNPKVRPVDWDGRANPYPAGTTEYTEWADGYDNAITNAQDELADAFKALDEEAEKAEAGEVRESSLDRFCAHVAHLANTEPNTFLAIAAINMQLFLLGAQLMIIEHDLRKFLPNELYDRVTNFINECGQESENREVERIGSVEDRLSDFKNLVTHLRSLGAEIAALNITTPYGVIGDDLYHFSHMYHEKRYQEAQANNRQQRGNRRKNKRRKR